MEYEKDRIVVCCLPAMTILFLFLYILLMQVCWKIPNKTVEALAVSYF